MLAVLSVGEMREADAATLETVAEATLVRRAGQAVALAATELLGGAYGRRVVVLAGKGNNGADGRVAAAVLSRRGAAVTVVGPEGTSALRDGAAVRAAPGSVGAGTDLVIDAVLGTGFRGSYDAPPLPEGVPVLAVDIPSGVNGDTGEAPGRPLAAARTVTMAALKRGLLVGEGPALAGEVVVADIGVGPGVGVGAALVTDADVAARLPRRPRQSHKWMTAVTVVAGSPGMEGAAALCAHGATRAGAGMVRLGVPGSEGGLPGPWPLEAVRLPLPAEGWAGPVLEQLGRSKALVLGPGLGRAEATQAEVRRLLAECPVPAVVDADALFALGSSWRAPAASSVVVTPHDGEYARLYGGPPGGDRIGAAAALADAMGVTALLKGPVTAVAPPARGAQVLLTAAGSPRLATAGTGDVLSGVIGAFAARGLEPTLAAALGAHAHGRAASLGFAEGLGAGDLPDLVARFISGV